MNSEKPPITLQERIMEKIQDRELMMRSRLFFMVKLIFTAILALLVLSISIFLVNLLFFTLRVNGHEPLLALGTRGLWIFILVFPWWLLLLDIVLLGILENVIRRFKFGYRSPTLYLFLLLIVLASGIGAVLDRGTHVNDQLLKSADQGTLPSPLTSLYQGARRMPPRGSAYRGTVMNIVGKSFTLSDPDRSEDTLMVQLPDERQIQSLSVGETVFVVGDEKDGIIHAYEVHAIDPTGLPPHARR